MWLREYKAKKWTQKIIKKNMKVTTPIDCQKYIHNLDKVALEALKKYHYLTRFAVKYCPSWVIDKKA